MGIIAWVVLGLLAGAIAQAVYPGYVGGGILVVCHFCFVGCRGETPAWGQCPHTPITHQILPDKALGTILLGIIGAFIGGSLYTLLSTGTLQLASVGFTIPGLFIATIGAIIAIFLWRLIARGTAA